MNIQEEVEYSAYGDAGRAVVLSGPVPAMCTGRDQGLVRSRLVLDEAKMRSIPKTRLAAVTRTVELATGAMCVSQWLTCF